MQALEAITFDTSGFTPEPRINDPLIHTRGAAGPSIAGWTNGFGDTLTIHFFQIPPDLPTPFRSVEELRDFHRPRVAENGGGIVSIDVYRARGLFLQETIYKFPGKPEGVTYAGALTIPFAQFSYVIKLQCPEGSPTGLRETAIAAEKLKAMGPGADPRSVLKGWAKDPYDPAFLGATLRNESEDEKYDARFPTHPLTRCRRMLLVVRDSVALNAALLKVAKPFPTALPV